MSGDWFVASPSIALHSFLLKGFQQLAKDIIEQKMVFGKNRLSRKRRKNVDLAEMVAAAMQLCPQLMTKAKFLLTNIWKYSL